MPSFIPVSSNPYPSSVQKQFRFSANSEPKTPLTIAPTNSTGDVVLISKDRKPKFWTVSVAPASSPSADFVKEVEQTVHQLLTQDYAGPVSRMLAKEGIEFRLARYPTELLNGLDTGEKLFQRKTLLPVHQDTINRLRFWPIPTLEQFNAKDTFVAGKQISKAILDGSSDEVFLDLFARLEHELLHHQAFTHMGSKAFQRSRRVYLQEIQRDSSPEFLKLIAKHGLNPPEFIISKPTLLRHEIAHMIDELGEYTQQQPFSKNRDFRLAVINDVTALAHKNLIPFKVSENALIRLTEVSSTFPRELFNKQFSLYLPASLEDSRGFREIFAELLAAMHGGHGKIIEKIILRYTGDLHQYDSANSSKFVTDLFPSSANYVRQHVLPTIAKHYP
jgi:hypothetical protein